MVFFLYKCSIYWSIFFNCTDFFHFPPNSGCTFRFLFRFPFFLDSLYFGLCLFLVFAYFLVFLTFTQYYYIIFVMRKRIYLLAILLFLCKPINCYDYGSCFAGSIYAPEVKEVEIEPLHRTIVTSSWQETYEFDLMCSVVEAEAADQGELGKAYVCDVILNRARLWDLSIEEVIFQTNAFESVNKLNTVPSQETIDVVTSELISQKDYDILYFKTEDYHIYGTPAFCYKDHYFSN